MSVEPSTRPSVQAKARTTTAGGPASVRERPGSRHASANGRLQALSALGSRFLLVLLAGASRRPSSSLRAKLLGERPTGRLTASWLHSWANGSAVGDVSHLLLLACSPGKQISARGGLLLEGTDGDLVLESDEIEPARLAPALLGSQLAQTLDADSRASMSERILSAIARRKGKLGDAAPALAEFHDALRERLPSNEAGAQANCAGRVEALWRVDQDAFYVEGWALDREARLASLRLLTPEGRRIEILDRASRYRRPDVSEFFGLSAAEKLGFIAFVQLPEESLATSGWTLQAEKRGGERFEVPAPAVLEEPLNLRTTILHDMQIDGSVDDELMRSQLAPAMTKLQRRLSASIEIDVVDQHGVPPERPQTTIIVPLYRRTEYLEHQLAQFVHDPEISAADLIYVLDSPEDAPALRTLAGELFDLYGLPFRLAVLSGNGGFSTVNNLGAELARGQRLLLLNSDVLPRKPGWLSRMVALYDANPEIGALSPKLLYEDDSIQHAGLRFEPVAGTTEWSNEHFYKGLHRLFDAAGQARPVPAVTGACLLIDLELYRELGGLRGIYVQGDYEDSDLCLRLRERGRECWYTPEVELYHLEGRSYPSAERDLASRYNRWLHSHLWREALRAESRR